MEPLTLVLASEGLQSADAVSALSLYLPRTQAAIKRQVEEGVRKGQLERSQGELLQHYLDSVLGSSLTVLKMSTHKQSAGAVLSACLQQAVVKAKARTITALRLKAMDIGYKREVACRQIGRHCHSARTRVLAAVLSRINPPRRQWQQGVRTAEMVMRRNQTIRELFALRRWKLNIRCQFKPLCKALKRLWRDRLLPVFTVTRAQNCLRATRQTQLRSLLRKKVLEMRHYTHITLQKWRLTTSNQRSAIKRLMTLAVFKPREVLKTWRLAAARGTEGKKQSKAFKLHTVLKGIVKSHLRNHSPANLHLLRLDTALRKALMDGFRRIVDRSTVPRQLRGLALCALRRPREALCKWKSQAQKVKFTHKLQYSKGHNLRALLQPLTVLRTNYFVRAVFQSSGMNQVLRTLVILSRSSLKRVFSKWHFASVKQEAEKTHRQVQGWKASRHLEKAMRPALRSPFTRRPLSHSLALQQTLTFLTAKTMRLCWNRVTGLSGMRVKPVLLKLASRPMSAFQIWKQVIIPKRKILRGVALRDALLSAAGRTLRPIAQRLVHPRGTIARQLQVLVKKWNERLKEFVHKWQETEGKHSQREKQRFGINRAVRFSTLLRLLPGKSLRLFLRRASGSSVKAGCRLLSRFADRIMRKVVKKWQKTILQTGKSCVSALKLRQRLELAMRSVLRLAFFSAIKGNCIDISSLLRAVKLYSQNPRLALSKWSDYAREGVKLQLRGQLLGKYLVSVVLRPLRSAGHILLGSWWTVMWSRMAKRPISALQLWRSALSHKASPVPQSNGAEMGARRLNQAVQSLPKRLVRAVFAQLVAGDTHARVRVAEVLRIMKLPLNEALRRWHTSSQYQVKSLLQGKVKGHQLRIALAYIPIATCNLAFHQLVHQPNRVKTALRALMRSSQDSMQAAMKTWQRYTASIEAAKLLSAATIHRIQYLLNHVPTRLVNGVFQTVTAKPQKTKSALRAVVKALLLRPRRCLLAWRGASRGAMRMALRREVMRRVLRHSTGLAMRSIFREIAAKTTSRQQIVRGKALARVLAKMPRCAFTKWKLALHHTKKCTEQVSLQGMKLREILISCLHTRLKETFRLHKRDTEAGARKVARLFARRVQAVLALWRSRKAAFKGKRLVAGLRLLVLRRERLTFDCLKTPATLKRILRGMVMLSSKGQQTALSRWKRWALWAPAAGSKLQSRLIRVSTSRLRGTLRSLSSPKQVRQALRAMCIIAAKHQHRAFQLWQRALHSRLGLLLQQHTQYVSRRVLRICWNELFGKSPVHLHLRVLSRVVKGALWTAYLRWRALVREHTRRTLSRRATIFSLKLKSASARRLGSALAIVTVQSKSTWILLQSVLKWRIQAPETRIRGVQSLILRAVARTLLTVLGGICKGKRRTPSRQRRRSDKEARYLLLQVRATIRGKMQAAMTAFTHLKDRDTLVRKVQGAHKAAEMLQRGKGMSVPSCFHTWKAAWHLSSLQEKALLRLVFGVSASYQSAFWKWKLLVRRRHKPSHAALLQRLRSHANQQEWRAVQQAGALQALRLLLWSLRTRQLARALGRIQALAMASMLAGS